MSASNQPIIIKKKKVSGHGGHHGGSWKVAYADFVTAMMAFFMVMWIMGMSEETRKGIASYFNNPVNILTGEPASHTIFSLSANAAGKKSSTPTDKDYDQEQKAMESAAQKIKAEMSHELSGLGKDVKVTVTSEGLQIELVETRGAVFFESGSAVIRPAAREIVARLAPILARMGKPMEIQGHTDAAPCGGPGGNFGLSTARAISLMQSLRADGCPENQFREVVGYGPTRLERPDKPLDFSNRRVTILIPREVGEGGATPAAALKDKLQNANEPQAIDLGPQEVGLHREGDRAKEAYDQKAHDPKAEHGK